MTVDGVQFHDHRVGKSSMRHPIAEHDPPIALCGNVNRFVPRPMQDRERADGGLGAENSSRTA